MPVIGGMEVELEALSQKYNKNGWYLCKINENLMWNI